VPAENHHCNANVVEDIADIKTKLDGMALRLDNQSTLYPNDYWPSGIAGWPFLRHWQPAE
jgi:hypothetical protein